MAKDPSGFWDEPDSRGDGVAADEADVRSRIVRVPHVAPPRSRPLVWATSVGAAIALAAGVLLWSTRAPSLRAPTARALTLVPAAGPTAATSGSTPPSALPAVVAAVEAARQAAPIPSDLQPPLSSLLQDYYRLPNGCFLPAGPLSQGRVCHLGPSGSTRRIVIVGDSHAREWIPAVLNFAAHDGYDLVPFIKEGCLPTQWFTGCRAWFEWVSRTAQALHPDVALLASAYNYDLSAPDSVGVAASITADVGLAAQFADAVVFIGDPPAQDEDPVDCLLAQRSTMATCTLAQSLSRTATYARVAAAVPQARGRFLDTSGWFCYQRQCPMVVGRTIAYRDAGHLTRTYAVELGAVFRSALEVALGVARGP